MNELKNCPFCGEKAELRTTGNDYTKKRVAEIRCKSCCTKMRVGALKHNLEWCEKIVTENWNTRKIESQLLEAVLAYQELCTCYRLGRRPSEKLFVKLKKADKALEDM